MTARKGSGAIDVWSAVHFVSGIGLGVVGLGPWLAIGAIVGFEVLEAALRGIKGKKGGGLFEYESWPNVVADIVVGALGYLVIHAFWPGIWPIGV